MPADPRDYNIAWWEEFGIPSIDAHQPPEVVERRLRASAIQGLGNVIIDSTARESIPEGPKDAPIRIRYRWTIGILAAPGAVSNIADQLAAERRAGFEDAIVMLELLGRKHMSADIESQLRYAAHRLRENRP